MSHERLPSRRATGLAVAALLALVLWWGWMPTGPLDQLPADLRSPSVEEVGR